MTSSTGRLRISLTYVATSAGSGPGTFFTSSRSPSTIRPSRSRNTLLAKTLPFSHSIQKFSYHPIRKINHESQPTILYPDSLLFSVILTVFGKDLGFEA